MKTILCEIGLLLLFTSGAYIGQRDFPNELPEAIDDDYSLLARLDEEVVFKNPANPKYPQPVLAVAVHDNGSGD